MAVTRYKLALGNARFPLVSTWGQRAVVIPSMDLATRTFRGYQGEEENLDYNIPQVLYCENVVPVTNGLKSVCYVKFANAQAGAEDFDQVFPLRDSQERVLLFSPSKGQNYRYNPELGTWSIQNLTTIFGLNTPTSYTLSEDSEHTPATAKVTRAYVDGKTIVAYSRLGYRETADPPGPPTLDGSLFLWQDNGSGLASIPLDSSIVVNLDIPIGEIDGVASSNGYLIVWSGLTVYWALFNGTAFDFKIYNAGEPTGSGFQIPEDLEGNITAIIPVAGGFIIFSNKNAVASFYTSNNFTQPWVFRKISNAGGVESYEQVTVEGNLAAVYAYTTGGIQRISLNSAESEFPDVADFLGSRYIEHFSTSDYSFYTGQVNAEAFVKVTYCGQRFLVISYGTYPGIYSYALVFDTRLKRWGKLRIVHRDCFSYSYGTQEGDLTYAAMWDVMYADVPELEYEDAVISSGGLVYPRQAIAFLLNTGEIRVAAMDYRLKSEDDLSEAFVLIGRNQLSRTRYTTLHEVEVEGLRAGGKVVCFPSSNGIDFSRSVPGYVREQTANYSEWGFDMPTGKNFTLFVSGDFALTTMILHATTDGMI